MDGKSRQLGQVLERDGMRVPVLVAGGARDQGNLRPSGREEGRRAARLGAVVADLQQIDVRHHVPLEQGSLHRRLRVTLQQRREAAAAQERDD
jgi:predicted TIM-barrel enzyme